LIDTSFLGDGITPRKSEITLFQLPGEYVGSVSRIKSINRRIFQRTLRRVSFMRLIAKGVGYFQSRVVGYDSEIVSNPRIKYLEGYFQSYKHVEFCADELLPLELKNRSVELDRWLKKLEGRIPIAVHIRRGDYVKVSNEVGILSPAYYLSGLEQARIIQSFGEVWVFSDDHDYALEVAKAFDYKLSFPHLENAAEELYLMSRCPGIVISNSTFSWWAAYSGNHEVVICPDKWFRRMEDPEFLIPAKWRKIESRWNPE